MKSENGKGYILVQRDLILDNRLSPFDRLLLLHIGAYGEFFESTKQTAKLFGVSEQTVSSSKRRLVKARCIIEVRNTGHGKRYMLNQKYLWETSQKPVEK